MLRTGAHRLSLKYLQVMWHLAWNQEGQNQLAFTTDRHAGKSLEPTAGRTLGMGLVAVESAGDLGAQPRSLGGIVGRDHAGGERGKFRAA